MKTLLVILSSAICVLNSFAQTSGFTRGADISWCTEMEADGRVFRNAEGAETDIFALMNQIGMTAILLRVWVNPQQYGYGVWKPAYYQQLGWGAYGMGAFTTDGRPTAALDAFAADASGITTVQNNDNCPTSWFDLKGRLLTRPTKGLLIMKRGLETKKIMSN